jgi:hypothetical protein
VKLVLDIVQHQRIKLRLAAIEKENQAIKQAKEQGIQYIPIILVNDDTTNNFWREVAISLPKEKSMDR